MFFFETKKTPSFQKLIQKIYSTTGFSKVPGTQQVYSKPLKTNKMENFATTVNEFQPLTNGAKLSMCDVYEIPSYACILIFIKPMIKHPYS